MTMPRTSRLLLAAGATMALLAAACGGPPSDQAAGGSEAGQAGTSQSEADQSETATNPLDEASREELAETAAEEGEVVVYSFTSRIADVETAFEKEYPDIDLMGLDIDSTEQITRLQAEQQAGAAEADVAFLADAPVVIPELVQPGILIPYVPPAIADDVPAEYTEPLLSHRLSTKVLMYNEEAHPDGPPVDNLWALTEPEWQGKVVMVDPQVRGDYLDLLTEIAMRSDEMAAAYEEHFGEAISLDDGIPGAGEQWISDLYANDLVLVDDTDNVNAAIGETGQDDPPVGFTSYSDRRDNEEEGWALQVAAGVEPAPGIAYPAYLGVVKDAPHPAAARLVIDFLMGDDSPDGGPGFEPFYTAGDYPTRESVEPPDDALPLDEVGAWTIDPPALLERRQDIADLVLTLQ